MKRRDLVISLVFSAVAQSIHAADPKAKPPDGVLGARWGSPPPKGWKQFNQTTKDGLSTFTRTTPAPAWEGTPIREESLHFQHGKLYSGVLHFREESALQSLRQTLQRLYGAPTFMNEAMPLYKWDWQAPKTSIVLSFRKGRSEGMLSISRN